MIILLGKTCNAPFPPLVLSKISDPLDQEVQMAKLGATSL